MALRKGARPALVAGAFALSSMLGACGGAQPDAHAPVLTVISANYALAQLAKGIGQDKVKVVDVVPPGANPLTYELTRAQRSLAARAKVVLEASSSLQPSLARAARRNRGVVVLPSAPEPAGEYFWLDPHLMSKEVGRVARALERADPQAKRIYVDGTESTASVMSDLEIDYFSTLSDCPDHEVVTTGRAFLPLEPRYGVTVRSVPDRNASGGRLTEEVASAAATMRRTGVSEVFTVPWASNRVLLLAASRAKVKVGRLYTLLGPPPGGWPSGASYFSLMEQNLGYISGSLQCPQVGSEGD